ncbi:MAG: dimethylarginine dimethylaminohydrolase [Rhodospirillales bacterium]|nr:dimethylarginine dimethylaminohydrolase [Rhodospirillales bacterium]
MTDGRSFRFSHFLSRKPAQTIVDGLREGDGASPDPDLFQAQHAAYVTALEAAGGTVTLLPALEDFPDSVFIEDPAIVTGNIAIVLRPGAESRFGEADALRPTLLEIFPTVIDLPGEGFVDGGDVLLSDNEVFIGLSARTDQAGFDALAGVLGDLGYRARKVETPPSVLHFKTDCGLLDSETIFASRTLAATDCFQGYRVIEAPDGEEAAANLVRINDVVLLRTGFPKTATLLRDNGYDVRSLDTSEAAKVDGGLSCMSLRFSLT